MHNDYNLPDGVRVRDLPGFGRKPTEHSPECLKYNRRAARHGGDTDCICGADDEAEDEELQGQLDCDYPEEDEIEVPAAVTGRASLIAYHANVLDAVIGLMEAKL